MCLVGVVGENEQGDLAQGFEVVAAACADGAVGDGEETDDALLAAGGLGLGGDVGDAVVPAAFPVTVGLDDAAGDVEAVDKAAAVPAGTTSNHFRSRDLLVTGVVAHL
ncbi:hypothetical protein ACFU7B_35320, partial [Streptomyces sp. NPDC057545]